MRDGLATQVDGCSILFDLGHVLHLEDDRIAEPPAHMEENNQRLNRDHKRAVAWIII